ncbi:DedA family protein [Actinoplanes couchii]|uniref:Membrane protein n=1 Tax=Actinoplanes couchii TaxID=403638 RepID=A0ABQ3XQY0_9ACTN|nr:VTT domain-containing protein [Actinoplanes couchii]MDR6318858.1 membrane protein DedA with SNARE-associated domain [Actinoplanes couchii]GID60888.1 membrane protein [Actinoplanes couchii]
MNLLHTAENVMTSPAIYLLVFVLTLLDAVLPIMPAEAVVVAAGAFAVSGRPDVLLIVLSAALGILAGDHVMYRIGRGIAHRRPESKLAQLIARITPMLRRRGGILIVTGRFVPGGRISITAACGATRYPAARFTVFAAIAALLWSLFATMIGFLGGKIFEDQPLYGVIAGIVLALAITGVAELVTLLRRRRRPLNLPSPDQPS